MKSKKLLSLLAGTSMLLLLVLFLAPKKTEQSMSVVRVAFPPHLIASLPHWVALDRKLYEDQGLMVHSDPIVSSKTMIDALYTGEIDVLPAVSLKDVLVGLEKRTDSKSIVFYSHSRMRRTPPFENILVPVNSPISTLKDLKGKNIAVYPGGTSKKVVNYFLSQNDISPDEVTIIEIPPPEHFSALSRGDVDASHSYEPLRTQYISENAVRSLSDSLYASLSEPSAIGVSVMSKSFSMEKPDAKRRFLKAWDSAIYIIRNEPTLANRILSDRLKISQKIASDATWVDATTTEEFNKKTIQKTSESLKAAGVISFDPGLLDQHFIK